MRSAQSVVGNNPLCLCDNALYFYQVGVAGVDDVTELAHCAVDEEVFVIDEFLVAGEEYVLGEHLVGLNEVLLNEVHVLAEVHEAGATEVGDVEGLVVILLALYYGDEDLAELVLGLQILGLLKDFFAYCYGDVEVSCELDCGLDVGCFLNLGRIECFVCHLYK